MQLRQGRQGSRFRLRRLAALPESASTTELASSASSPLSRRELALGTLVFLGFFTLFLLKAPGVGFYFTSSDHGFQLSVGTQVLLGRVPGTDVVIGYGPLGMYTSALGLWLTGNSLIGETIICAIGHALCLFLIYHLLSRYASKSLGLVAAGFGFLLQIRLYKWYVWLIPLAVLWVWHRFLLARPERRGRWIAATGLILGVCWLYRPDFGTTETAVVVVLLGLFEACEPGRSTRRVFKSLGILIASAAVLPLAWLGYLALRVGLRGPFTFLETTVMAALAVSQGLAHPPPPIRSVLIVHALLPATYLFVVGAVLFRIKKGSRDAFSWFLLASAMAGLACQHQSLHRMDPGHLLQVLAPAIVCAALVASWMIRGLDGLVESGWLRLCARWAGVGYALLLALLGMKLPRFGQVDLDTFSFWPYQRYARLASPLSDAATDPQAAAAAFVARETRNSDSILVFPLGPQFYSFAQRRISGRLHAYYPGVLDTPRSQADNLAAIEADMPKLVVVPSDWDGTQEGTGDELVRNCRRAHANVERFIRANYPRVVLNTGGSMVLSRFSLIPHLPKHSPPLSTPTLLLLSHLSNPSLLL